MRGWGRGLLALGLGLAIAGAAGCVAGLRGATWWGPFRGQVVDLETGEPIAGAVALAVWWEVVATPVQGLSRFYDAREAVTRPDGRFEIPRVRIPFWKLGVQPGAVSVFAPGYEVQSEIVSPRGGTLFIDPTVVRMRALRTREERIRNLSGYPPASVPNSRVPRLLEAIRRERVKLGLKP